MASQAIIDVCVELIIAGLRSFEQVPSVIQSDVESALKSKGYGVDGKPIEE